MNIILKYIIVFLVSMVPIIELRGAIPIAFAMGLDENIGLTILSFIVSIIGNMVPVPFIYLFARKVLEWGTNLKIRFISKFCTWCLNKGERAGHKLQAKAGRGLFVALLLFVGIPLPGTGAWTGTLAASFLKLDFKKSVIAVLCGVLMAGIIMMAISFCLFEVIF